MWQCACDVDIYAATPINTPGNSGINALKYGAGRLNPVNAPDPGLVYDASESDYVAMLRTQGYNACANGGTSGSGSDLNYPTMAALVEPGKNFTVGFLRTVTNVGVANAVYDVKVRFPIEADNGLRVDVSPTRLEFSAHYQKVSFTMMLSSGWPWRRERCTREPSCGINFLVLSFFHLSFCI
jgi:hypothetical protein